MLGGLLVAIAELVMGVRPALVERYSWSLVAETGGAGRWDQWQYLISELSFRDWLFGASFDVGREAEGWAVMAMHIGLVGMALLTAAVVALTRTRRGWRVGLVVLLVGAIFDSSFRLFPTWFLPAAMMAVAEFPAGWSRPGSGSELGVLVEPHG
jgi:hypothetical protein